MTFSVEWDAIYAAQQQLAVWPWSDLITYVMRYCRPIAPGMRVLELGCGAGANIPFFLRAGFEYYAIEGSPTMVAQLHHTFPDLRQRIVTGDFTKSIPFDVSFDLVVDRAALTHNGERAIRSCLAHVRTMMKPGAKYVGIDWFSTTHADHALGSEDGEPRTRSAIERGQFTGVGRVHFSDRRELQSFFADFELLALEEKIVRREVPDDGHLFASWNFCAVRS